MMIKHIDHPDMFKAGARIILVVTRHKDGSGKNSRKSYASYRRSDFDRLLGKTRSEMDEHTRIYASVSPSDMDKAIREFKICQLDADYDHTHLFYENIQQRFISALGKSPHKADALWLVDCDSEEDFQTCIEDISEHYDRDMDPYVYDTKNGKHIVLQPFNTVKCSEIFNACVHKQGMMLWSYGVSE